MIESQAYMTKAESVYRTMRGNEGFMGTSDLPELD
jgi:hypothetical protein